MSSLHTPISELKGAGKTTVEKLKKLEIETIKDVLYHFPYRYENYGPPTLIKEAPPGANINIQGEVEIIQNKKSPRKNLNITEAIIEDHSGKIKVIWFNQPFIARNIRTGQKISLAGKIESNFDGPVLNSPVYEMMTKENLIHTRGIVPVYPLTEGVTQKQIRLLIFRALSVAETVEDWLPREIKDSDRLYNLREAIKKIHAPRSFSEIKEAKKRLAFDELFLLQLKSQLIKKEFLCRKALPLPFQGKTVQKFVQSLPFTLTDAQRKAAWEILQDIEKPHPMARLLEGDVGSGKTVVAAMAMLNASCRKEKKAKNQSALMAPTEVLAEQHAQTLNNLLQTPPLVLALLTGSKKRVGQAGGEWKTTTKKKLAEKIQSGEVDIVIGTHSLIQEDITFRKLALAVVDEQHRFGVEQRKALANKSGRINIFPHLLSMTATPIPRSLALALFSDLDISIIDQKPGGRKPVVTEMVPPGRRDRIYRFVKEKIQQGRQAFVICPLIDSSPAKELKSAKEEYNKLKKTIFPDLSIGILHGKLNSKNKEKVMRDFLEGKYNILVATSVVEVGVDVSNATIMIIEGADRFGLSQLHQFRGRVGRGEHRSYCFLFTDAENESTQERLQTLTETEDGFVLAKKDLQLRGSGDLYGRAQKGFPRFKVASLFDRELMEAAKKRAAQIMNKDPELSRYPALKYKIKKEREKTHRE